MAATLVTYQRWTVACLLAALFLQGVSNADPVRFSSSHTISSIVLAVGASLWCASDATLRRRYEIWKVQWQLFASWPVSIPAYIVCTRRWRAIPLILACSVIALLVELTGRFAGRLILDRQ